MFFAVNAPDAILFSSSAALTFFAIAAAAAVVFALCSVYIFGSVAQRKRGEDTYALPPRPGETELDRLVTPLEAVHPAESGLQLLANNLEAFRARLQTAQLAGRSLDLQYYFWKADLTGRLLCRELIFAADRGVRVRLLLDDINSFGFDRTYIALDSHPNIEVRLFNPSRSRSDAFRRGIELIVKYFTATRRMHNKCWIADGRIAIVGGRNIGDEYFDASEAVNFQDIDVVTVGGAVAEAEAVFDDYWNSEAALPVRLLHKLRNPRLRKLMKRLETTCNTGRARTYLYLVQNHDEQIPAFAAPQRYHWSREVDVIADPPEKASGLGKERWLGERINVMLKSAVKSLRIISPYFIPGEAGAKTLIGLAAKGVDVRVLTNSLAATDVIAVHGAYARYRKILIQYDVSIHELKPGPGHNRASLFGSKTASLHTKAFLVDGELGFVGSFNLDPRSRSINTEMGLLFRSPSLALELQRIFANQSSPEASYLVEENAGRLSWTDMRDGVVQHYHSEPGAPLRRILPAKLIAWLPIESQL